MRMGLVGNTIYYGGMVSLFGYLGWEIWNIGKNMPQIDDEHPANEIFVRRRKERRATTIRDQPMIREQPMSRFDQLQSREPVEVKKPEKIPAKKQEEEDGYM